MNRDLKHKSVSIKLVSFPSFYLCYATRILRYIIMPKTTDLYTNPFIPNAPYGGRERVHEEQMD